MNDYPKKRKAGSGRPANTPAVLWSKVDKRGPEECWPWTGYRNAQGYGRTWIGNKGYYAHRVIFNLANPGVIALEAPAWGEFGFLMHTCDNPPCCNPAHLRACTHEENMADASTKGRMARPTGAQSYRAKLTEDDVLSILIQKKVATKRALAMLYDVSVATVGGVLYGRHYQ